MPKRFALTPDDRTLLRRAYSDGPLKIPEIEDEIASRALRLEEAGLMRSVESMMGEDQPCRYFVLSGSGVSHLG